MINGEIIWGAMCVSSNLDILKLTIPNLLKFSDQCLFLLDNEIPEVEEYILNVQKENYDKVWLRRSSFPHKIIGRNKKPLSYHDRWRAVRAHVRNEIFVNLKHILQLKQVGVEKISVLLFPDSDEMWNDYLPELLKKFIDSEYKAIACRHVHPINDLITIKDDKMRPHVHIFKWQDNLSAFPRQWQNQMYPIKWNETMIAEYYSIHLCYLSSKIRKWRSEQWKSIDIGEEKLYKLPMSVEKMRPEEIKNILNS